MKGKGERGNRDKGLWGKGREAGGRGGGRPAPIPVNRATAADGRWGKTERVSRGFYSRAHLELGRRGEMDRRAAAVCRLAALVAARWGARMAVEARLAMCGTARRWCRPFIGAVGRFPGKISLRRPWRWLRQGGPRRPSRGDSGEVTPRRSAWLNRGLTRQVTRPLA
jgi:hypothetical protein